MEGQLQQFMAMPCRPAGVREQLLTQREIVVSQLGRIDEALSLLESQPQVADVLDALAKLGVR